ncbi:MAG: site-specific integrase [Tenuifilaceae bacterium]|nr:site-specific integrase [Tenuifilaceae bacterium]
MSKANINIYLKSERPDKSNNVPLIAQVTINGRKIRKTLCKVKKKHWNSSKQAFTTTVQPKADDRDIAVNQKIITAFKTRMEDYFSLARYEARVLSYEEVRQFVLSNETQFAQNDTWTFKQAWQEYINSKLSTPSKREAGAVLNFLLDFEKETGTELTFQNQSMHFYYLLRDYSYNVRVVEQNYFAKIVKVLKAFLNWCNDMDDKTGYTGNNQRKYKKEEKSKTIIYLTEKEQIKLYNYQFENTTYAKIRDLFMFSCNTSLRISDILSLEHTHIKNNIIYKNLIKTDVRVSIPLTDAAKEILERYKEKPIYALPHYSEQYINRQLKDIFKLIEIDEPTRIETYKGGIREEFAKPKHELVTFHTARKTFCCNCVRAKIPLHVVKKCTGHRTDSELQKYYEVEEALQIEEMSKLNFNLAL